MADLTPLLRHLVEVGGTDLYVKAGTAPHVRVDGHLAPAPFEAPGPEAVEAMVATLLPAARVDQLAASGDVDVALGVAGLGRFRLGAYRQRGTLALAVRRVVPGIPGAEALGLPSVIERIAGEGRGLVLMAGPAGSGRSTTVNVLVDQINRTRPAYVVTVEDPVEYLHADRQAVISQREVGTDAPDAVAAVAAALRHAPDVLVVGELGDVALAEAALDAAQCGRLVVATVTATSAEDTVARVVDLFAPHRQAQARQRLAAGLRAVLCQRLLHRADRQGRVPAVEILISTPKIAEAIGDPERHPPLSRLVAEGQYHGMQSLDHALHQLFLGGLVGLREVLAEAESPGDLRITLEQDGLLSGR